jgi:hypothetical protein
MKKIKVRFHLAQGENYMHWQVKYPDGETRYFNPENYQLVMFECKLHNQRGTAEKICYEGQNKTVCAWIECDEIIVSTIIESNGGSRISYNPRVKPHWMDVDGNNIDKHTYHVIKSINNKLHIIE